MSKLKRREKESYTSLSLIDQCPYQYKLHYVDALYKTQDSIALDIGNLCHKIMELKLSPDVVVTNEYLIDILDNGYSSEKEKILGIKDIRTKYFEDFITKNSKSNLTYIDKIEIFRNYILNYKSNEKWKTVAVELPFSLQYGDFVLTGKIDRVDIDESGNYKVTDYKTANVVYDDSKLKTPLQMYIYALAIKEQYGKFPIEFEYDFVVLGEKRLAMTKGWEKRGEKALNKLLEKRKEFYEGQDFPPKPSPLCHWCPYIKQECEYYCLWEPNNKTFSVNKPYSSPTAAKKQEFVW